MRLQDEKTAQLLLLRDTLRRKYTAIADPILTPEWVEVAKNAIRGKTQWARCAKSAIFTEVIYLINDILDIATLGEFEGCKTEPIIEEQMSDEQKDLLRKIKAKNNGAETCSWEIEDGHQAGTLRHLEGNEYIEVISVTGKEYLLKITPAGMLFLDK